MWSLCISGGMERHGARMICSDAARFISSDLLDIFAIGQDVSSLLAELRQNAIVTLSQVMLRSYGAATNKMLCSVQTTSNTITVLFKWLPSVLRPAGQQRESKKHLHYERNEGARLLLGSSSTRHPSISSEQATALFGCWSKPRVRQTLVTIQEY